MRVLQIEALKLKKPANYVMLGLLLLIVIAVAAITFHELSKGPTHNGTLAFWSLQGMLVKYILVVFIIMNIGKEYSDSTLRRTIIDGFTRDEFFRSKLCVLLLSVIFIYLIQQMTLLSGGWISGHSDAVKTYLTISTLINSFYTLLSDAILAFFLVFITRSVALSIVFYFVWGGVEHILSMLEKLYSPWSFSIGKYLPLTAIEAGVNNGFGVETHAIIIATAYLSIMMILPYFLLLKRDIK